MDEFLFFHHIGIACRDIDKSKVFYVDQGYTAAPTTLDPLQRVKVCFLEKQGVPRLELLEPVGEDSPVARTLAASGVPVPSTLNSVPRVTVLPLPTRYR